MIHSRRNNNQSTTDHHNNNNNNSHNNSTSENQETIAKNLKAMHEKSKKRHFNIVNKLSEMDPIDHVFYSASMDQSIIKWSIPINHQQIHKPSSPSPSPPSSSSSTQLSSSSSSPPAIKLFENGTSLGEDSSHALVYNALTKIPVPNKFQTCTFVDGNSLMITTNDCTVTLWEIVDQGHSLAFLSSHSPPPPPPLSTSQNDAFFSSSSSSSHHSPTLAHQTTSSSLPFAATSSSSSSVAAASVPSRSHTVKLNRLKSIYLSDMGDSITCAQKLGKLIFLGSNTGRCKVLEVARDASNGVHLKNHTLNASDTAVTTTTSTTMSTNMNTSTSSAATATSGSTTAMSGGTVTATSTSAANSGASSSNNNTGIHISSASSLNISSGTNIGNSASSISSSGVSSGTSSTSAQQAKELSVSMIWKCFNHRNSHHRGRIHSISVIGSSVKKYLLATCGADGFVRIWNLNDAKYANPFFDPDSDSDQVFNALYVVRVATLIQVVHPYSDVAPVYQLQNVTCDDGSYWHVRFWVNEGDRRVVGWSCRIPQDGGCHLNGGVEVSELRLYEGMSQFNICRVENTDLRDGNGNFDLLLMGWNVKQSKFDLYHLTPKSNAEKQMNKLCFKRTKVKSFAMQGTVFVKDCDLRASKIIRRNAEDNQTVSEVEANVWYANQYFVEGHRFFWKRPYDKLNKSDSRTPQSPAPETRLTIPSDRISRKLDDLLGLH